MYEDVNNGVESRNDAWLAALKSESARKPKAYAELMEIKNRQKIDALNKQLDNDEDIVSMIGATEFGGGKMLGQNEIDYINGKRGKRGENGQLVDGQIRDAGYNENGDYQFDVWKQNPDGTMGVSSRVMPKKQVYGIMKHYDGTGMFDGKIDALRQAIVGEDESFTDDQFNALGAAYGQRRRAIEDQIGRAMYGVSGISSRGGRGGLTFEQQKELSDDKYDSYLMKNAFEMFKAVAATNPELAGDPTKAGEWIKGLMSSMRGGVKNEIVTEKPNPKEIVFEGIKVSPQQTRTPKLVKKTAPHATNEHTPEKKVPNTTTSTETQKAHEKNGTENNQVIKDAKTDDGKASSGDMNDQKLKEDFEEWWKEAQHSRMFQYNPYDKRDEETKKADAYKYFVRRKEEIGRIKQVARDNLGAKNAPHWDGHR